MRLHLSPCIRGISGNVVTALTAALIVPVGAAEVLAAPTTFIGVDNPRGTLTNSRAAEANFKAALTSFGTETVEGLPDNLIGPTISFGSTGVTAVFPNSFVSTFGADAISPGKMLGDLNGDDVITFSQPVQAFGFFLVDLATTGTANTLTYLLQNTTLGTSQSGTIGTFGPTESRFTAVYLGLVDEANPFNRVTIHPTSTTDAFFYDDLTAGLVPEPASLAVLGLGGLGLLRKHRRTAARMHSTDDLVAK